MNPFWLRIIFLVILTSAAIFLESLFSVSFVMSGALYLSVVAWTLTLPFRKALLIGSSTLFLFDIFSDGTTGVFLFVGILVMIATAFFSIRVEKGVLLGIGTVFYGSITFGGLLTLFLFQTSSLPPFAVFIEQLLAVGLLIIPVFWYIERIERGASDYLRDRTQKIR